MDHAQSAPRVHPADAERFFTEGTQAWPPEPAESELWRPCCKTLPRDLHKSDCRLAWKNCPGCTGADEAHVAACPRSVLIDVPGEAKPVPATQLPAVLPGKPYLVGETPETLGRELYREERDRLMINLLFASRRLADTWLRPWAGERENWYCAKCGGNTFSGHDKHCPVGFVVQILDDLQKLPEPASLTPSQVSIPDATGDSRVEEAREWIIQRCTQKWDKSKWPWSLLYEEFPVPEGVMTRSEAMNVLLRVDRENPGEFRAHRVGVEGGAR